jgi:hypothetical protein
MGRGDSTRAFHERMGAPSTSASAARDTLRGSSGRFRKIDQGSGCCGSRSHHASADAVERARQPAAGLRRRRPTPAISYQALVAAPSQPSLRAAVQGTLDSVPKITAMISALCRPSAGALDKIAVVSAIDAARSLLIDKAFGALPAEPNLAPIAVAPEARLARVIDLDVPQR